MAPKKPAKKPAAKRRAPTPQVNRMPKPEDPNKTDESTGSESVEETQAERDAAGDARRNRVMTPGKEDVPDYEPKRQELEHKGVDHHGAEAARQRELELERDEHNARTGDASANKGTWN